MTLQQLKEFVRTFALISDFLEPMVNSVTLAHVQANAPQPSNTILGIPSNPIFGSPTESNSTFHATEPSASETIMLKNSKFGAFLDSLTRF